MRIRCICLLSLFISLLLSGMHNIVTPTQAQSDTDPEFHIVEVSPEDGAIHLPQDLEIHVEFSNDLNFSTVNDTTFQIIPQVLGELSYYNETYILTFTPEYDLANEFEYTVVISKNLQDIHGNNLTHDYTWTFQVGHHHPVLIDFYCAKTSLNIAPGGETTFNVSVNNTLCGSGYFEITHSTLPTGWNCSISATSFYLGSGSSKIISVTISAPEDAKDGEVITVRILGQTVDDMDQLNLLCIVK